ncbi:MAG: CoA transferase [Dehalococcoidia bacterium]|nr:CoA transferase [Dehalococcoidia bacterium]
MQSPALSDLRVLDLTHLVAGPYCTKFLADFGAEVIKIEKPGDGDGARRMAPFYQDVPSIENSGLFMYLNTNKKSITLNLKSPDGVKLLLQLVREADIVVENFQPRVMPGLGLSYESLREVNPDLIMTSISNYGQSGQYRDYKAYGLNIMAMGGLMNITGETNREPLAIGGMQVEFVGGLYGLISTLMAIFFRNMTGAGQHVDVSLMESVAANLERTTIAYSFLGAISYRGTGRFFNGYPWGIFPCKDGHIFIIPGPGNMPNLALMVEQPDLVEHHLFKDVYTRMEHPELFDQLIVPWLMEHERNEIVELATDLRMPFAPVVSVDELLINRQLLDREYFTEIEHPAGKFKYPGLPFRMSESSSASGRAPLLGEHNQEVYVRKLGYAEEDLVRFREQGTI